MKKITARTVILFIFIFIGACLAIAYLVGSMEGTTPVNEHIGQYSKAIEADPQDVAAYNNRGVEYQRMGEFGLAAEDYLKAIKLDGGGDIGELAYDNLNTLARNLREVSESLPKERSNWLFNKGIEYFDKGLDLYKREEFGQAKKCLKLALSIFASSRMHDPDNRYAHGFIYLTKGFMYHNSAFENILAIKSNDTNYTVLVYLRRAYYPIEFADAYYELSLKYLTEREFKDMVKGYQKANDFCAKQAKKFLPQVDYWAQAYMKNIKREAEFAVSIDRLNELLVAGDYEEASKIIKKLDKQLSKLKKSQNVTGFTYLGTAYARLTGLLPYVDKIGGMSNEQKSLLRNELDTCISDLKRARSAFKLTAFADLCDSLRDYVTAMRESI